jgi:hypothetical protein
MVKTLRRLTLLSLLSFCPVSCTYNISMIHTEGQATDVMDSQQSADVDPSVPVELNMPGSNL